MSKIKLFGYMDLIISKLFVDIWTDIQDFPTEYQNILSYPTSNYSSFTKSKNIHYNQKYNKTMCKPTEKIG